MISGSFIRGRGELVDRVGRAKRRARSCASGVSPTWGRGGGGGGWTKRCSAEDPKSDRARKATITFRLIALLVLLLMPVVGPAGGASHWKVNVETGMIEKVQVVRDPSGATGGGGAAVAAADGDKKKAPPDGGDKQQQACQGGLQGAAAVGSRRPSTRHNRVGVIRELGRPYKFEDGRLGSLQLHRVEENEGNLGSAAYSPGWIPSSGGVGPGGAVDDGMFVVSEKATMAIFAHVAASDRSGDGGGGGGGSSKGWWWRSSFGGGQNDPQASRNEEMEMGAMLVHGLQETAVSSVGGIGEEEVVGGNTRLGGGGGGGSDDQRSPGRCDCACRRSGCSGSDDSSNAKARHGGALIASGAEPECPMYSEEEISLEGGPVEGRTKPEHELGDLFARYGGVEAALEVLQRAAEVNPSDPRVWNELGNAHRARGNADRAVESFSKALQIRKHPNIYLNLGGVHYLAGDLHQAERMFREGLKLNSDHWMLHFSLANTLLSRGMKEEALKSFEETLRLTPDLQSAQLKVHALQMQVQEGWWPEPSVWAMFGSFCIFCILVQRMIQFCVVGRGGAASSVGESKGITKADQQQQQQQQQQNPYQYQLQQQLVGKKKKLKCP
ncbi:hypothetical protein CBR_g11212 [Chara braunii]|uniref:Uncharacterized protein n=1 Tax=Chara braunii TaxID=69332 RepID=A0A388KQF4_CHABU|nr:hypothetical protein CBR_g11212 [Chara braunii]|eukprot:GBG72284.1 hypothetical protein CBR_g11212 [Chara braunii]